MRFQEASRATEISFVDSKDASDSSEQREFKLLEGELASIQVTFTEKCVWGYSYPPLHAYIFRSFLLPLSAPGPGWLSSRGYKAAPRD